jgi:cytochrome c peroxidase
MFWDNRGISLEDQAIGPIHSKEEMRGENFTDAEILNVVIQRLENNATYVDLFNQAFGSDTVDGDRIAKALASFERTLVNNNTPFDRYSRGETNALNQKEIRGLNLFIESGCTNCHNGPMLSDFELHQLPVSANSKQASDNGVDGKFRTPTLRNLAFTAPFMHNGTKGDLKSAISFYHNISNPSNDPDLAGVDLDDGSDVIDAIAAFLLALSDTDFDQTIPTSVPSGLNPGGDI